jgi:protein-tyrosine phosphatase
MGYPFALSCISLPIIHSLVQSWLRRLYNNGKIPNNSSLLLVQKLLFWIFKILYFVMSSSTFEWWIIYIQRYYPHVFALPENIFGKSKTTGSFPWLKTPYEIYEGYFWDNLFIELMDMPSSSSSSSTTSSSTSKKSTKLIDRYNKIGKNIVISCWPSGEGLNFPFTPNIIVDLTNEVEENPKLIQQVDRYVNFPIWDQCLPINKEEYLNMIRDVVSNMSPQDIVLVHCIAGMGRSTTTAALMLIAKGEAQTVQEAYDMITKARPFVRWRPDQRAFVEEMAIRLKQQ